MNTSRIQPPTDESSTLTSALGPRPPGGTDELSTSQLGLGTNELHATQVVESLRQAATGPCELEGYTRVRLHAQGGVGQISVVRDEKLGRTVALKELRPDRQHGSDARQRFLNEAIITSQLEHPGIVPVHELELDSRGEPYYVMRFIQGKTLADAIEEHYQKPTRAGLRALLTRFISVCQTIAYAHEHGIMHRDLKPANIMLGEFGETLVLDWGLAKRYRAAPEPAASGVETMIVRNRQAKPTGDSGELTQDGEILGTPAFMAPEQAAGEPDKLGPATDIYALGATLYQILCGEPPFKGQNIYEIFANLQAGRLAPPSKIAPRVPRSLEAICKKAMALRPEDRYVSAKALADDVDRWMGDEPVSVRREPFVARASRWLRRHQRTAALVLVFLGTALVALLISTFLMGQANETIRKERDAAELARQAAQMERDKAQEAERRAEEKARESEAVQVFLIRDMLGNANPSSGGYQFTVKAAMDLARPRVAQAFKDQPGVEARLLYAMGVTYEKLSEHVLAEQILRRAAELATRVYGVYHPLTHDCEDALANSFYNQGRYEEAAALQRQIVERWKQEPNQPVPLYIRTQCDLLATLTTMVKLDEAEALARELEEYWKRQPASPHQNYYLNVLLGKRLATLHLCRRRFAEAEECLRRAYREHTLANGSDNLSAASLRSDMGFLLMECGRFAEAEAVFQEALQCVERFTGPDHERVLTLKLNISATRLRAGRFKEADEITADVLARARKHFPTRPELLYKCLMNRGASLTGQGRFAEAKPYFQEAAQLAVKKPSVLQHR